MSLPDSTTKQVVVITGANSGIGLSLADRLLNVDPDIILCLACRHSGRAEAARKTLLDKHPNAVIDLVLLDTSDIKCVYETADTIRRRYSRVDFLYLNAGIMPVTHLNWLNMFKALITPIRLLQMLTTGEGLLNLQDYVTADGLQGIFCTNMFGHFVLINELEDVLCKAGGRIVWTTSNNAQRKHFNMKDIQHKHGCQGYSSSKYAIELLSIALNETYNKHGVYSHLVSPGVVSSKISYSIMPSWMWTALYPVSLLIRMFAPDFVIDAHLGAESMVWAFKKDKLSIRPDSKYCSCSSMIGNSYVVPKEIDYEHKDAMELYGQLEKLHKMFVEKYKC